MDREPAARGGQELLKTEVVHAGLAAFVTLCR